MVKDGWVSVSVGKILRSRNLLGEFDFIEKVDGIDVTRTVQRADPLVDHDTFAQLQHALGNETRRRTGASILLDVAFCGVCGEKVYHRNINKSGNTYRYYGCSGQWGRIKNGCRRKSVRADALEDATTDALLSTIGNFDYFRTETIGGIDHSAEIDDTERKIADLVVMMAGQSDGVKRLLEAELDRLNTRLEALSAAPATEATTVYVPTGETYAEVWARSGGDERRELLVNSGIRIEALEPAGDEGFVNYWHFERPTKVVEESSAVQVSITHGIPILMWIPKDIIQRATHNDRRQLTFVERPLISGHG